MLFFFVSPTEVIGSSSTQWSLSPSFRNWAKQHAIFSLYIPFVAGGLCCSRFLTYESGALVGLELQLLCSMLLPKCQFLDKAVVFTGHAGEYRKLRLVKRLVFSMTCWHAREEHSKSTSQTANEVLRGSQNLREQEVPEKGLHPTNIGSNQTLLSIQTGS